MDDPEKEATMSDAGNDRSVFSKELDEIVEQMMRIEERMKHHRENGGYIPVGAITAKEYIDRVYIEKLKSWKAHKR